MAFQINYSLISSPGNVRTSNQDNLIFEGKYLEAVHDGTGGVVSGRITEGGRHIFGVFDGMGGHEKGEMASYIAAKAFAEYPMSESDITIDMFNCCINANLTICKYASENKISRIGTTAVLAAVDKGYIHICNIGDSRLYICRNNEMKQLSVDHVTFAPYGRKAPLSQNLGIPETAMLIEPYTSHIKANTSDRFVLCSDGLTDMVQEAQIREIISSQKPDEAVHSLYSLAMKNGGRDNITIIVFEIINPDAMPGCGEVFKTADPFEDTQGAITPQDIESDVESSTSLVKRKSSGLMPALCAALLAFVLIAASVPLILKGMRINRTSPDKNEQTTIGEFVTLPVSELYVQTSNDFDINDSETTEITEPTIVEDGVQSIVTNEDNSEEQSKTEKEPDLQESDSETDKTNDDNIIYEINADTESSDNSSKPDETGEEGEDSGVDADEQKRPEDESADNLSNEIEQKIGEGFLCENIKCTSEDRTTVYHEEGEYAGETCYIYSMDNNYCEECKTYFYEKDGVIEDTKEFIDICNEDKSHEYSDSDDDKYYVVKEKATCNNDGYKVKICIRCNHESHNRIVIPRTGQHDYVEVEDPIPNGNLYTFILRCNNCGDEQPDEARIKERDDYINAEIKSKENLSVDDFYEFLNDERTGKYCTKDYLENEYIKIYEGLGDEIKINEKSYSKRIASIESKKAWFEKLNACYQKIYNKDDENVIQVLNDLEANLKEIKSPDKNNESNGD